MNSQDRYNSNDRKNVLLKLKADLRSLSRGLIDQMWSLHVTYEDYVASTQPNKRQMARSSSPLGMDDYLIPGIGLRFDLMDKAKAPVSSDFPKEMIDFFSRNQTQGSQTDAGSVNGDNTDGKLDSQQLDDPTRLNPHHCQTDNELELINNSPTSNTCGDGKNSQTLLDSSAWSIDCVTIKSGKHRTNRLSKLNKARKTTADSSNSIALSSQTSQIANRSRSSHYGQAPPSCHPYSLTTTTSTTAVRQSSSPYRLKPIVHSKPSNKDTSECADSRIKSSTVNKQMVSVNGGISTNKSTRADRWEGGIDSRGSSEQTTVANGLRRGWFAHHKLNRMDKKTMMKRQCMYFPVDDYVTLSPLPASMMNDTNQADDKYPRGLTHDELRERLHRFSTDSFDKQLSPMTISSGYESDYSPPWTVDMERMFSKRLDVLSTHAHDDSHTDYFSQSDADHKTPEENEKRVRRVENQPSGRPNQLTSARDKVISSGCSGDGYDNLQRSRSETTVMDKSDPVKEKHRFSLDISGRDTPVTTMDTHKQRLEQTKIYFEKYLLSQEKRGLTPGARLCGDSAKNVQFNDESNSSVDFERHRDVDGLESGSCDRLLHRNNPLNTSKRYRLDRSRDSLCKSNVSVQTHKESQSNVAVNSVNSRVPPIDIASLPVAEESSNVPEVSKSVQKKSPALRLSSKMMSRIQTKNETNIQNTNSLEEIKINSHSLDSSQSVGDSNDDNSKPVTRNAHNPGCVKSPRGKHDSDYEHIYDVIPGDENISSPQKHLLLASSSQDMIPAGPIDLRRARQVYKEVPPALPARTYLKSKGDNSSSSAQVESSSVEGLYSKVNIINKHLNKIEGLLYASPLKSRQTL